LEALVRSQANEYRPDIDGLRAISIILVMAFHAFPKVVSAGFVGVDVFFVISGFLITGIIAKPGFSFADFYLRRVRRLFPALALVLAATMVAGWFFLTPREYENLGRQAVASALFMPNLLFWSEVDYFDSAASAKPLLHLWSLGVEEQFYLLWPIVFLALGRRARWGLALISAASLSLYLWSLKADGSAAFYSPLCRAWELGCGGLLAISNYRLRKRAGLAAGAAIATLFGISFPADEWHVAPIVAVACAVVLIVSEPSRLLGGKAAVYVGRMSYPLYLWHWPFFSFLFIASNRSPSTAPAFAALAATFVLAAMTHKWVEAPVQGSPQRSFATALSAASVALLGMAGTAVFLLAGVPARFPTALQAILSYERYDFAADALRPGCWLRRSDAPEDLQQRCISGSSGAIAVWGDSYAARLSPGIRAVVGAAQVSQFSRDGCAPLVDGPVTPDCARTNRLTLKRLADSKPGIVLLFAAWDSYGADETSRAILDTSLRTTIRQLKAELAEPNILLIGPAPRFDRPLPSILMRNWVSQHWQVAPERIVVDRRVLDRVDAELAMIARDEHVEHVSLLNVFCEGSNCLTAVPGTEGELVTWDYGHFTTAGAVFAARRIAPTLTPRNDNTVARAPAGRKNGPR
jgi:peptidoglycan/LPS O-acetylase OafA/YrhL